MGEDIQRTAPGLVESLWRYRAIVVVAGLLGATVGYLFALQQPPSYEASARLFLDNPQTSTPVEELAPRVDPELYFQQQFASAESRTVRAEAAAQLSNALGEEISAGDVGDVVEITGEADLLIIDIVARAETGEDAALVANAMATAFGTVTANENDDRASEAVANFEDEVTRLEAEKDSLNEQLEDDPDSVVLASELSIITDSLGDLRSTIRDVRLRAAFLGDGVRQIETAEEPEEPAAPKPLLTAVLVGVLAAGCAGLWSYWQAGRARRAESRIDPQRVLGVPPLGEIPLHAQGSGDPLARMIQRDTSVIEAYEFVLASLEFAMAELDARSVLITSALPGDGKTSCVLQLGIAAAGEARTVTLVDADIRARGLTRLLKASDLPGLSELATSAATVTDVRRRYRFSDEVALPVVTAGARRQDPAAFLRARPFRDSMREIRGSAELVLVDTSPLLAVADATVVAHTVDAIVLVVTAGTRFRDLEQVRERLSFTSTPVLGYIYNRAEPGEGGYGYGYGYGYGASARASTSRLRRLLDRGRRATDHGLGRRNRPDRTRKHGTDDPPEDVVDLVPSGKRTR